MTSEFSIQKLGECNVDSPIILSDSYGDSISNYVGDGEQILYNTDISKINIEDLRNGNSLLEKAGPRKKIFFQPDNVHAAIVTCGGLCPGLNDVIRSIVMCLWYRYGIRKISGIRYGYRGFIDEFGYEPMELYPNFVLDIHRRGGTILGSSRGYGDRLTQIADNLEKRGINILFTIGGDGTQRGSLNISKELRKRGSKIAVVGIPKTIDNDLSFMDRSFGFETAVAIAVQAVYGAHIEAYDAPMGIGIVKLMGRQSGFIAAHTALAQTDANYVFVPELDFELDGPKGLLVHLHERLKRRDHALIIVAEGAGQKLMASTGARDASGNLVLSDIGIFLKNRVRDYFVEKNEKVNIKYIDPSYIIRSQPANPNDSVYCTRLGANAVHAAMSGRTELLIGMVNNTFVHVPTNMAVSLRNCIDPEGPLWRDVLEATGQPTKMVN